MNQSQDPLLPKKEAAVYIGFGVRSLEREVAAKRMPPPVKLRGKAMFLLSDVTGYLTRVKAERNGRYTMP